MRVAHHIVLTEEDRFQLETLATSDDTSARLAKRARIILLAAEGEQNKMIAPRLGIGRAQVARWRERFAQSGMDGILNDLPRGAPPVRVDVVRLAMLAGEDRKDESGGRSVRSLAAELGVSAASVSRHRRAAGLQHNDAHRKPDATVAPALSARRFTGQGAEFVGLYVAPREHALVLAYDECDHDASAAPAIRAAPGNARSLAASVLTGLRVIDGRLAPPRGSFNHEESWLAFLREVEAGTPAGRRLWILADNPATSRTPAVLQWLHRHARMQLQLASGTQGWLRMVHQLLRDAHADDGERQRGRGLRSSIPRLLAAIEAARRSGKPPPYSWVQNMSPEDPDGPRAAVAADTAPPQCAAGHEAQSIDPMRPMLPIASTKVLPPRGAGQLMPREAFMGRLLEARRRRCVVIQGQAGSGKTSTLMAWRKALISLGYDVSWLSLSAEDNEPAQFLDYVLASIAEVDPGAVSEAAQVLNAGCGEYDESAVELWVIRLVQGLSQRQRDLVLMIDDLHHVSDRRILQALQLLLDYSPPRLHLTLASRTALELSMERLRLQGMLAEFDMRDLRFSPEETERFLRKQLGTIDSGEAAAWHAKTDGWAAGLQLFAIGLRNAQGSGYPAPRVRDARAFANFFEREVLGQMAPDDLEMLTRVAICQRFCVPLCAEVLGQPQAAAHIKTRITKMVSDHLFITPVGSHDDETWYRMHPLLRETLLARLTARGEDLQRALHAAAWRWFEAGGHVEDAVLHAVRAGDCDAAARLVEGCAKALLVRGELSRVSRLLRMLPHEEVRNRFALQLVMAYSQLYSADFDALRESLARMEAQVESRRASDRYSLCLLRAGMALQLDDTDEAASRLPEIRAVPPDADEFARYARANVLSWLFTLRGEYDIARAVLDEAEGHYRSPRARLLGSCIHAAGLLREGQTNQAGKIVREVMEQAEARGPGFGAVASMAAGLLADTLYELNELDAVCELLEPRIPVLERGSLPELMLRACLVLSNAYWLTGRKAKALACLERLEAYTQRYQLDRLMAEAHVQRLRRHLQQGEMEQANRLLERMDAMMAHHAGPGPQKAAQIGRARTRSAVEMALYTKDFSGALEHLGQLFHLFPAKDGSDPVPAMAALHMQAAVARLGQGDRAGARRDFAKAIRAGHSLGLMRTLLDVLEPVPDAFHSLAREPLPDPVLTFYVHRLMDAHGAVGSERGFPQGSVVTGRLSVLSEREREILELLAQAMSNKRIARILNVSAETVKWHLKNIYAKLGVAGRGGAAALLRDTVAPEVARAGAAHTMGLAAMTR